jgi:hypothetical protein
MGGAVALVMVLFGMLLQLLGHVTTCTQGADGSYITGAALSFAPLLLSAFLSLKRGGAASQSDLWLILTGGAAIVTVASTNSVWVNTFRYSTPCGEGYEFSPSSFAARVLILAAYLILPLVIVIATRPWSMTLRKKAERHRL